VESQPPSERDREQDPSWCPKPSLRSLSDGSYQPPAKHHLSADERDRLRRWKHASPEARGRALEELLELADCIGNFPPKRTMFPGFRALVRATVSKM
jgi:hypothetical protein